jgi:hypothetical protein
MDKRPGVTSDTFHACSNEYVWPKKNYFHAWVKKCHISLSEKLPKWHFLTHA